MGPQDELSKTKLCNFVLKWWEDIYSFCTKLPGRCASAHPQPPHKSIRSVCITKWGQHTPSHLISPFHFLPTSAGKSEGRRQDRMRRWSGGALESTKSWSCFIISWSSSDGSYAGVLGVGGGVCSTEGELRCKFFLLQLKQTLRKPPWVPN